MILDEVPQEWQTAIGAQSFSGAELDLLYDELNNLYSLAQAGTGTFVFPDPGHVFRALCLTPPDQVRVVILGKDPYPQAHPGLNPPRQGVADGLAFSSAGLWPQASLTPLLWNLWESGLQTEPPCGADLEIWARRGVLLLNASPIFANISINRTLRTQLRSFTQAVLAHCAALTDRTAFLILGSDAWDVANPILSRLPPEQVIRARHPSRPPWPGPKDLTEPFVALNTFLGTRQVDWSLR